MSEALAAELLVMLVEKLGPPLAELAVAGIKRLIDELGAKAPSFAEEAAGIVSGIQGDAFLDAAGKRRFAVDAIKQLAVDQGVTMAESSVNALVELAVVQMQERVKAAA